MAKEKPKELEPLETETLYFIEHSDEFPFPNQWIIYSNTKYGKKMFMNYYTKESAESAAKVHGLTLLSE